jgi:ribosomal protein L7Ae-like RNA K-turn-binding protein
LGFVVVEFSTKVEKGKNKVLNLIEYRKKSIIVTDNRLFDNEIIRLGFEVVEFSTKVEKGKNKVLNLIEYRKTSIIVNQCL